VVERALVGEDEQRDVGVAEHGQLPRLLGQPAPPLRESHLPAHAVVDPTHLHLAATATHISISIYLYASQCSFIWKAQAQQRAGRRRWTAGRTEAGDRRDC